MASCYPCGVQSTVLGLVLLRGCDGMVDMQGREPCGREPVQVRLLLAAFLTGYGRASGNDRSGGDRYPGRSLSQEQDEIASCPGDSQPPPHPIVSLGLSMMGSVEGE